MLQSSAYEMSGFTFPGGRRKALALSYDDGRTEDRCLVDVLNRYELKATFHLNSGRLGTAGFVRPEEVKALFSGHEIGAHTVSHPHLPDLGTAEMLQEVEQDCRRLEDLSGRRIRGLSYPFGGYDQRVVAVLPQAGIRYARTVNSTGCFDLPKDFLCWHPTCHHDDDLVGRTRHFLALEPGGSPALMLVWGHSYEFREKNCWETIERFCRELSGNRDVWFATCGEIYEHLKTGRENRMGFSGPHR